MGIQNQRWSTFYSACPYDQRQFDVAQLKDGNLLISMYNVEGLLETLQRIGRDLGVATTVLVLGREIFASRSIGGKRRTWVLRQRPE